MTSQLARAKPVIDELRLAMRKPLSSLSKPWWYLICAAVFFFALALRIAHSRAGLPYIAADAEVYSTSIYMNRRQSLDPLIFDIPSLSYNFGYFVNLITSEFASAINRSIPAENLTWQLEGWGSTLSNPDFLLVNRLLLSFIGATTCLLGLVMAQILIGRLAGVISGLALAVNPFMIAIDSRFSPNGLTAFFFTLSSLTAMLFFIHKRLIFIFSSLASVGLAAGSKYTGALALFAPLTASLLLVNKLTRRNLLVIAGLFLTTPLVFFGLSTPYALVRPFAVLNSVLNQRLHYFTYGHYGADVDPGISHLVGILTDFNRSWPALLLGLALVGLLISVVTNIKLALIFFLPQILYILVFASSAVRGHSNHALNYPMLAVGVGAGVSFFIGLWLVARQRKWRGSSLLAVPMVAVFVPVGLAVAGGFQQIVTDWRYQDPRVKAIDALATGQYGGTIVFATELRVHPAERERLSGVASAQVLPLEQIVACDFLPDTTLVLPTSVTTWREAAARRIGETKPPNELNASLQQLLANANSAAKFGANETVLDYNFTDPEVIIVRATDISSCA